MDFEYYNDSYPFICAENSVTFYDLPVGVEEELLIPGVKCLMFEPFLDTFHESLVVVLQPGKKWDIVHDIYEAVHKWSLLNL